MVHMCKIIISRGVLFIFSKSWFSRLLGSEKANYGPNWQKIMPVAFHISGNIHHMIFICGTQVWNGEI